MVIMGEILAVRATKLDEEDFSYRVDISDEEGSVIGIIYFPFVELGVGKEKSRCINWLNIKIYLNWNSIIIL